MPKCLTLLKSHYSHGRLALLTAAFVMATLLVRCCLPFLYDPGYRPKTMKNISTERVTHCVGRYLVDLPKGFELLTGGWGNIELYYGLGKDFETVYATVKGGRYTQQSFWDAVNAHREELKRTLNNETKGPMLIAAQQINNQSALVRQLPKQSFAGSLKSEVHVLVGSRYVILEQASYDKSERIGELTYKNVDPAPAETRLKTIAAKLKSYERAERALPGFCMQGVLFDVGQDDETAIFHFRSSDFWDVFIDVNYHAVTGQPSKGLIERSHEGFNRWHSTFAGKIAVLRERQATLGGGAAEESLIKTVQPVTQHIFDIERRSSEKRTLDNPFFGLTLTTGNEYQRPLAPGENAPPFSKLEYYDEERKVVVHRDDNASLSDQQVLELWDGIVDSVRKRN